MTSTYSNDTITLSATGGSGEVNTIESISTNGTAKTPDANKNVDILLRDIVPTGLLKTSSSGEFFNFLTKTPGLYYIYGSRDFQYSANGSSYQTVNLAPIYVLLIKSYTDATTDEYFGYLISRSSRGEHAGEYQDFYYELNGNLVLSYLKKTSSGISIYGDYAIGNSSKFITQNTQIFTGLKKFNTMPQFASTPTNNNDLTNKSYVDTAISTAIGTAL